VLILAVQEVEVVVLVGVQLVQGELQHFAFLVLVADLLHAPHVIFVFAEGPDLLHVHLLLHDFVFLESGQLVYEQVAVLLFECLESAAVEFVDLVVGSLGSHRVDEVFLVDRQDLAEPDFGVLVYVEF